VALRCEEHVAHLRTNGNGLNTLVLQYECIQHFGHIFGDKQ
jgi:hypothetical protein